MASRFAEARVRAPTAGLDTASADTYVAANRARTLTNFLPGRNGKLPIRGPVVWFKNLSGVITLVSGADSNSGAQSIGWTFDDKVLVGSGVGTVSVIDFANPASPTSTAEATLASGHGLLNFWADASVFTVADGSYARLGNYVYGPCTDNSGNPAGLVRWDGTGVAGGFVEMTNGPKGARSVATWLDRVWALGGSVPGVPGTYYKNHLYWTDPEWDGTDTLAKWQDDVTGLTNQIVLDDSNDEPLALAVFNRSLLVLRRRSIVAVTGSSPANFSVRTVAHVGCASASTVVVHDSGVYFLSDHGYMVFDGASVRNVSDQIEDSAFAKMRDDILGQMHTTAGLLDAEHLVLNGPRFFGVMHIPTRSWSNLTLDGVDSTHAGWVGQTLNHPFIITNVSSKQRVCLLDHICSPEVAVANDNTFQDFGSVAYGGSVTSRIIEFASPESKASLRRVQVDSVPSGCTGFTVKLQALDGTQLGTTLTIASSANAWVQRDILDVTGVEVDHARVKWDLTSTTGQTEIQDVRIEFQPAQDRP